MLCSHHSLAKHLRDFRAGAEPPGGGEYGRTLRTLPGLRVAQYVRMSTPLRRVGTLVDQQSLATHLCFHDACTREMTKRRKNRTEAQLAAARRGLDAAAAASSHNTAAIVLATAGAPAPPFPRAVSAAIGRFHRTPTTLVLSGLLQLLPSRLMQRRWTRWIPLRSHHSTPSSLSSRDETSSLS